MLSFELGLLWPAFMEPAGAIIGMPFSLGGFAFFTEVIFFGVHRLARVAAAGQVSLILWGRAPAQYPYLIPPDLTIRAAAAPRITLVLVLWALLAGGLVLFPSLVYLLRVFKREPARP